MRRAPLLALLALALAGRPAGPFTYDVYDGRVVRWPQGSATMYYDPASVPPDLVPELQMACAAWNGVSGASWRFVWGGSTPSVLVRDSTNGNCDISHAEVTPDYIRAYCVISYPLGSAEIADRDVVWNTKYRLYSPPPWPGPYADEDYRTVMIHELGHVLGLMHEYNYVDSVMSELTLWKQGVHFVHSIFPDDQAGVRFLYPAWGTPPPVPDGPDAAVERVAFSPEDAGPGDGIEIAYTIRNAGSKTLGPFTVAFRLGGGPVPNDDDLDLGTRFELPLTSGQERTGTVTAAIPAALLPGSYRPGVLVEPGEATLDTSRRNNSGCSLATIRVEREPLAVPPVCRVTGDLGSEGRDTFLLDLAPGARVKIKARTEPGALSLALTVPGTALPLAATDPGRKVRIRTSLEADGSVRLLLDSHHPARTSYRLDIRTKPYAWEGEIASDAGARIPFPVHEGSRVSVRVESPEGNLPDAAIPGVETRAKVARSGRKVKLRAFVAARTETLELVLGPAGGPAGTVRYRIRVRPPAGGPPISR